jgi:hypothetical protein
VLREVAHWQQLQVTDKTVVVYKMNDVKGYGPCANRTPAH